MNKRNNDKFNEKALLLLIFSFLEKGVQEGKIGVNKQYGNLKEKTLLLFNIYQKLKRISKSFANFKIQKYLLKKVNNNTKYIIDVVYIAVLLLYFYRITDIKRTITPLSVKEAKELLEAIKKDLNEDEITVAKNYFITLYPEKEEAIKFLTYRLENLLTT